MGRELVVTFAGTQYCLQVILVLKTDKVVVLELKTDEVVVLEVKTDEVVVLELKTDEVVVLVLMVIVRLFLVPGSCHAALHIHL
jgi:hypothetical protein